MESQRMHVMTLANSIIGVSILAMPYCFKQCGIVLSIVSLLLSSIISRLACHFLLKSAIKARLRTFEFLAFHAFGSVGKLIIEIGMIGFLIGTCIAFFVVMGDLGPEIVAEMTGVHKTSTLRTSILMALALFCILPLGLLRNVDSLNGVCTATVAFYACLVLKIIAESLPHIVSGDWYNNVTFWRPAGILQCIPIFSMALFCQTQLFEIYQAIPNASLEKMNNLIRTAVNICTCVYVFVGIFGYIAVAQQSFTGNILMSFKPSIVTSTMKIGFVLSVAFSFPLVIFPCRASLHSLLYKSAYTLHEGTTNYIPEGKFKALTFIIVLVSLVTGVLIPNIELVLGLVGSTIGVMICVIFPATCFICLSSKNTNERILAQIMLFIGIVVMVLGTYANLYAFEEIKLNPVTEKQDVDQQQKVLNLPLKNEESKVAEKFTTVKIVLPELNQKAPDLNVVKPIETIKNVLVVNEDSIKEIRHEPPQPEAPVESPVKEDKPKLEIPMVPPKDDAVKPEQQKIVKKKEVGKIALAENKVIADNIKISKEVQIENNVDVQKQQEAKEEKKSELQENVVKKRDDNTVKQVETKSENRVEHEKQKKGDEVDIEAIKKEEKEIMQQEQQMHKEESARMKEESVQSKKDRIEANEKVKDEKSLLEDKKKAIQAIETIAKEAIKVIVRNISLEAQDTAAKLNLEKLEAKMNQNAVKKEGYDFQNLVPIPVVKSNNLNSIYAENFTKNEHPEENSQKQTLPPLNLPSISLMNVLKGQTGPEKKVQPENPKKDVQETVIENKDQINSKVKESPKKELPSLNEDVVLNSSVKKEDSKPVEAKIVDESKNKVNHVEDKKNLMNDNVNLVKNNGNPVKVNENSVPAKDKHLEDKENLVNDKKNLVNDKKNLMKDKENPVKDKENSVKDKESPAKDKENPGKDNDLDDLKMLRRDILSAPELLSRSKRQILKDGVVVSEEHCDKKISSPVRK